MKLAVMQPYLFPYLGYFQLLQAVDLFVLYDDVNYINRGWINRNNILAQGKAQLFTMELNGASQNKLINQISIVGQNKKLLKTIILNYSKAPYFSQVYPLIEDIYNQEENNLARFLDYHLRVICAYLGLFVPFYISSALRKDVTLQGQKKILAICDELGVTHYINPYGGRELYNRPAFESRGIELLFIRSCPTNYLQFKGEFVPNLSIIDVMMFNSPEEINDKLLNRYDLVKF